MNTTHSSLLIKNQIIETAKKVVEQRRMVGDPRFVRTNKNAEFKATYVNLAVNAWALPQPPAESFAREVVLRTIRSEDSSAVAQLATEVATAAVAFFAKELEESVIRTVLVRDAWGLPLLEAVVVGPELHVIGNADAARLVVKIAKAVAPVQLEPVATTDPTDLYLTRRCKTYADARGLLQYLEHAFGVGPEFNEPMV